MPTRTKDQNTLVLGEWNTICDVCGFKFKSSDLRRRWDGFMVCKDDWEPRHPMDYFEGTPDRQSVPWSRPEATTSGGTDISGDTFPPTYDYTYERYLFITDPETGNLIIDPETGNYIVDPVPVTGDLEPTPEDSTDTSGYAPSGTVEKLYP